MMLLLWPLNFAISWFNAHVCGTTWDSAKIRGGAAYFMNWMGAVMSASGFTWCYLVVLGMLGSVVPKSLIVHAAQGAPPVTGPLLSEAQLQAFFDLGYLAIIFPILGSGLAITVQAWREIARKKAADRTAGDYVVAGWDTFAQVSNTYSAIREVPRAAGNLGDFFKGDSKDKGWLVVVFLFLMAFLGGIATTAGIISSRRRAVRDEEAYTRSMAEAADRINRRGEAYRARREV
jgi:hypothetical protein